MNDSQLDAAYKQCAHIVKQHARNFYYSFIVLPKRERAAIYAVYAFCRLVDDIADEPGAPEQKQAALNSCRNALDEALAGHPPTPILTALSDTVRQFHIPHHLFHELIDGVSQDLTVNRYATFDAMKQYCYLVASTVGLMCLPIFGFTDDAALKHGIDLGIAMQITNIVRDVGEDASRNRIYIPQEDMAAYGYTEEELKQGVVNKAFRLLMQQQIERAKHYYASGQQMLQYVSKRTRACPALMFNLYHSILQKIEQAQYDVFSRRIGPSALEKWRMVGRMWRESVLTHS